ncbi:MAG: hypothetical protein IJD21_00360 [Oscillospiraceae bacterium]|nr:hypothetical protein [Oscillospiraceae bacterium]
MDSELVVLVKGKLNITWSDKNTDARVDVVLEDAIPKLCRMVGLRYDYETGTAYDGAGEVFDFGIPSMERWLLLNYCLYEWNHKGDLFWAAYEDDIGSCQQRHDLESTPEEEGTDGPSENV